MERLTDQKEADSQRREYENRLRNGYPRNIPEERFLRLAAYEDTGLEPEKIMLLVLPPNPPLTLDELREMVGNAVYCIPLGYWAEVKKTGLLFLNPSFFRKWGDNLAESYGDVWLAYRRKPEEVSA